MFHFNAYEPTALKTLVARHAVGEYELDELLRRKVLVDLYGISRQAIRAGVESYGLKALEPVIGFERDAELRGAIGSLRRWQAWQEDGDQKHLDGIAGYNEDDCAATRALYRWLLDRRPEAEQQYGIELGSLQPEPPKPPTAKLAAYLARLEAMRPRLLTGLPDDESEDTEAQRAVRTTFDLLGYHRREAKPGVLGDLRRGASKSLAQLRDEDSEALADLEVVDETIEEKRITWRMRFPEQDYKLCPGSLDEPLAERGVELLELDEAARTALVDPRTRRKGDDAPLRSRSRLALSRPTPRSRRSSVSRTGWPMRAIEPCGRLDAGTDLLLRRPPRLTSGNAASRRRTDGSRPPQGPGPRARQQRPDGPGPARDRENLDRRSPRGRPARAKPARRHSRDVAQGHQQHACCYRRGGGRGRRDVPRMEEERRPGGRVRQRSSHEQEVSAVGGRRPDPVDRGDGLALGGGGPARQRRRAVHRRGRAGVAR